MMTNTRKFSQTVVILTFLLAAWIAVTLINWLVRIDLETIDPTIALTAFGAPAALITLMFGIFKTVYTQYTETGLKLEQGK